MFFKSLRSQLEEIGFTLLENIVHPSFLGNGINVQDLFDLVDINFETYPVMMDKRKEKKREREKMDLWGSIFNQGSGDVEHEISVRKRRFMTLGHKLCNIDDQDWKRKKWALDIQLGNIIRSIYPPEKDGKGINHFAFPDRKSVV